jgi:UDP:flavonoid glycosyltransferase YjiC (YdhE family)
MSTGGQLAAWHRQAGWPADWPARLRELDGAQQAILDALCAKSASVSGLMAEEVLAFARAWCPDMVVYDAVSFAGKVAADALGVPAVCHLWGQAGVHRNDLVVADGSPHPAFTALMSRFGLPARPDPAAWIDPCPPSLRIPVALKRMSMRYVPYNGPGASPGWLAEPPRRPRVCVTWGLTAPRLHGPVLPEVIRGLIEEVSSDGAEVVVAAAADRDALGPLPDDARCVQQLPLQLLLPTCRAIVHPGGAGTTMTAAALGVPQLVVAMRPENMATGGQVAAAGAGVCRIHNELPDTAHSAALLAGDVARLLAEPSYREAATRLRADIRSQPSPAAVAASLEQLAARAGRPVTD